MNRIILIGNGFDLAHGLPTRYTDFINWYWKGVASQIYNEGVFTPYEDNFAKFDVMLKLEDDYTKTVMNISRNFNDKQKMRDIVVNWNFCSALVPCPEESK
jgi:hypothetical protein